MTLTDGTEGSADECRLGAQHAQAAQGQYIKTVKVQKLINRAILKFR